jgi:hypothetical protein
MVVAQIHTVTAVTAIPLFCSLGVKAKNKLLPLLRIEPYTVCVTYGHSLYYQESSHLSLSLSLSLSLAKYRYVMGNCTLQTDHVAAVCICP